MEFLETYADRRLAGRLFISEIFLMNQEDDLCFQQNPKNVPHSLIRKLEEMGADSRDKGDILEYLQDVFSNINHIKGSKVDDYLIDSEDFWKTIELVLETVHFSELYDWKQNHFLIVCNLKAFIEIEEEK